MVDNACARLLRIKYDPARKLYEKNGFTYAGDVDLERGIEDIPVFSLFKLNWGTV